MSRVLSYHWRRERDDFLPSEEEGGGGGEETGVDLPVDRAPQGEA